MIPLRHSLFFFFLVSVTNSNRIFNNSNLPPTRVLVFSLLIS